MKNLLFTFSFFMFLSCSKEYYFQRDQEKISEELKIIAATDQSVRNNNTGLDSRYKLRTFYTIKDSLRFLGEGKEHTSGFDFSILPDKNKQIEKLPEYIKKQYYLEEANSIILWKYIDKTNFEKLYSIIKKYGYPSYDKRKWKTEELRTGITFVLFHIDPYSEIGKNYFDLMLSEYSSGRVDDGEMRNYLWAFHGRQGMIDYKSKMEDLIAKGIEERKKRN